ncbi:hypothetical protein [Streptomyces sp. NPDC001536]|uniref:hypothetical protein n=1 Tax=Streptomyces sp. NPDC001536 TaxID=3364583 RepID=UPI003681E297
MPNGTEHVLAEVQAGVVHVDHAPPDSHFFVDRLRERAGLGRRLGSYGLDDGASIGGGEVRP